MVLFSTILLAAAAAGGLSSAVAWAAGIAGGIGFLVGSVPPRGANRGWEFDMGGAVLWAFSAALIVGGITFGLTEALWLTALFPIGLGVAFATMRVLTTLPPRAPHNGDLASGVHRAPGETQKQRLRAAKSMYRNASFRSSNSSGYYATRGLREFDFGSSGASAEYMRLLASGVAGANYDTFDILVVLVDSVPGEPGQPALVVVRGASTHRSIKIDTDGLTVPGFDKKIPASSILAFVGYAWR
ncbi:MAG: hypothetical protein K2Z81_17085 [Cyanobacteria bacterium]|nr:hypothetical protein [Cyanobacteriota bacterium]